MKRCSISFIIREMQITNASQNGGGEKVLSVVGEVYQLEVSCSAVKGVNCYNHVGKLFGRSTPRYASNMSAYGHRKPLARMPVAAPVTTAPKKKQVKCPSTVEQINKLRHSHVTGQNTICSENGWVKYNDT